MILNEILEIIKKSKPFKAYTINNKTYTYGDLYKYVSNIYEFLLKENPEKKTIIVYGHKDIYMKSTFIACSMAGMAYVPIDTEMPKNRVNLIINQVKPCLIIGNFNCDAVKTISQNDIEQIMNQEDYKEINEIYLKPEDIYYIIFTSGSTGTPKGVKVTYNNVDSCVKWLKEITENKRGVILNQAAFSFDLSVADLYLSLITGSEHYVIEKDVQSNFPLLFEKLKDSKSTMAVMTPSFADLLLLDKSFNKELMPDLKLILFCGEKLLATTVEKLYERFPEIKIINSYGPTECTFAVTSIELKQNEQEIPIGIPKTGVDIIILDENEKELKEGEVGEILIVGDSVADGYITDKKDLQDKFITYNHKKAYLTGDLGYMQNKILYYKCRKDKQIKYKGYRIELADIERNLYELSYIEKAVVVAKEVQEGKIGRILAFIKLKDNIDKNSIEIRKELSQKIPEYMCPTIKIVDNFPLNQNGKCDEKKLLEEY